MHSIHIIFPTNEQDQHPTHAYEDPVLHAGSIDAPAGQRDNVVDLIGSVRVVLGERAVGVGDHGGIRSNAARDRAARIDLGLDRVVVARVRAVANRVEVADLLHLVVLDGVAHASLGRGVAGTALVECLCGSLCERKNARYFREKKEDHVIGILNAS